MEKEQVENLLAASRKAVSLEKPVNSGNGESQLGDFVEDSRYNPPEQDAVNKSLENDIEKLLHTLNGREAEIIRLHYGLGNEPPLSLKELGDRFNLTKERIRQIEERALMHIKHSSMRANLESYVA
jgi:RNA polymerase primary sigma factor